MVGFPDGHGRLELIKLHAPPAQGGDPEAAADTRRIRHVAFVVGDLDASFGSATCGGPERMIVELAKKPG